MPYEFNKHSSLLLSNSQHEVVASKHFTQANGSDIIGREDVREISPLPEHFDMSSQREDNQNFMVLQACP